MIGANDGNLYRETTGCDGEGYSIYRTTDGGLTWTEHPLPTETTGTADTWNFEEAQVHPDEENNLHAMWMGSIICHITHTQETKVILGQNL